MGGAWSHRLVRGEDGALYLAHVRIETAEYSVDAVLPVIKVGKDVEDVRDLAQALLSACDQGIIGPDGEDPDQREEPDDDCVAHLGPD
jgi:hypothetical protein